MALGGITTTAIALAAFALASIAPAFGADFSTHLAGEATLFREPPAHAAQLQLSREEQPDIAPAFVYPALLGEAEFNAAPTATTTFALHGVLRYDHYDSRRRLLDLPEAKIGYAQGQFRARLGFDIESWGVMEYVNTSDVINQNDILDGFLSKRKLGQPMLALTWITPFGTWDAYALSFFRPMPLPGVKGRFSPGLRTSESPLYGSDVGRYQTEAALRTTGQVGPVDFSFHYFHGYEREPRFLLRLDGDGPYLRPEYRMLHQGGADALWVAGDWIFKTENAVRMYEDGGKTCYAGSVGLERSFPGIMNLLGLGQIPALSEWADLPWEVTGYLEYLYDTREASLVLPFTDNFFAGMRLAFNDAQASEVTLSLIHDFHRSEVAVIMGEMSMRPLERLKILLGGAWLLPPASDSPFAPLAQDSHARAKVLLYW
jgi:hypothetical protein